jgi:hypothetical protein
MDVSTLDRRLQQQVDLLLENGWQPADLAHFARRGGNVRDSRLLIGLLARHARTHSALDRAPDAWLEQLAELGIVDRVSGSIIGGHATVLAAWGKAERLHPDDLVDAAIDIDELLRRAPRLPVAMLAPHNWPSTNKGTWNTRTDPQTSSEPGRADEVDAKALRTIRALLAKAESTEFEAESESFMAKAQELMTRHSIDLAILAAAAHGGSATIGVESRRVHVENPYADEKSVLLHVIAEANGAKAIWMPDVGIATVMGDPVDLRLTDVMFTSLLLQAQRFSAEVTGASRDRRTPRFRRAFFLAFASRVGERLEESRKVATAEAEIEYGSALAPVLAHKATAVEEAYRAAFPDAVTRERRTVDAAGWYAGRDAANRADIGKGASLPRG